MSPSGLVHHLLLTSHVLQSLILPTQCTSLHRNRAAFTSSYISNRRSIQKSTVLLYQIIDEPLNKQRISPSTSNTEDALVDDDITTDQEVVIEDNTDSTNLTSLDTTTANEAIEDNKDWISATRTLGSLIFQMQDETKDSNVDVFGRPLVNNLPTQIDQFGLPKDYYDTSDGSTTGGGDGWQSSLASYLLKLKRDEEDNRERIFEKNKGSRESSINEDGDSSSKISINVQFDQVSFTGV